MASLDTPRSIAREFGMTHPVDLHVGQRLKQRRSLLGLTQQKLAAAVGIKFQQIQKYESGTNRISASRLWSLSIALDVPVSYFFESTTRMDPFCAAEIAPQISALHEAQAPFMEPEVFSKKETIDLVRAYYSLQEAPRQRLLDLAKTMAGAA